MDNLLYNWTVPSQACDIITHYKLVQQHWIIKDVNARQQMINGVGPMRLVKNNLSYSYFTGKRMVQKPDEMDTYRNQVIPGSIDTQDGILAFVTAQ